MQQQLYRQREVEQKRQSSETKQESKREHEQSESEGGENRTESNRISDLKMFQDELKEQHEFAVCVACSELIRKGIIIIRPTLHERIGWQNGYCHIVGLFGAIKSI